MTQISRRDIQLLQKSVEGVIGVLLKIQSSNYNEAEKLCLFITCARVLGRVSLWCTTLNHNFLHLFIWRCSYGYHLDLDLAIDYLRKYAMEFLNEIETSSNRLLGVESKEIEDDENLEGDGDEDF